MKHDEKRDFTSADLSISVDNVYNVLTQHMHALDQLWPDGDTSTPRKVHVVELMDAIKLALVQQAQKNADRHLSAFELAAKKVMGQKKDITIPGPAKPIELPTGKTAMQLAHEAAQTRVRGKHG